MRRILVPTSVLVLGLLAGCSKAPTTPAATLTTDDEKTIYAIGLLMNGQISNLGLSPAELDIIRKALGDASAGKPEVKIEEWGPKIDGLVKARSTSGAAREKTAGKEFADKAAAEKGAERLPSGLVYRELTPGTGATPKATDNVKVHYRGTLPNGTEFDSSYKRNEPAQFPLNGVIPCWTEGVQKIKVGGKSQLICPSDIAYGDGGRPGSIPGGATLVFEVELLAIY
jgi:FKBP-type peptidyl-prolyl cis-trans isomerase FkpA